MMWGDYGGGWWALMWIPMALFWLLLVAGLVWFGTSLGRGSGDADGAEGTLKRRLAAGEIDVAEYRALRAELAGGGFGRPSGPGSLPFVLRAALLAGGLLFVAVAGVTLGARADWSWGGWGMGNHMGRGGTNSANAPVTTGSASESVAIRDFAYAPGNLQVPVGATVRWTNDDDAPHTATAKNRDWDTGTLNKGESGSITFHVAGDYTYYCAIHPSMVARLAVR